jgi:hypothetical protein
VKFGAGGCRSSIHRPYAWVEWIDHTSAMASVGWGDRSSDAVWYFDVEWTPGPRATRLLDWWTARRDRRKH